MTNLFESKIEKVRALFLINALVSVCYVAYYGITLNQVAIAFGVFFLMNCLGITATFHRYYSHRSYEFRNDFIRKLCTLFGMLSCSGSAIGWAGIHRSHHAHSDTHDDPHQAERGFWNMLSLSYNSDFSPKLVVDLMRDKYLLHAHQYYFVPSLVYVLALYLSFGVTGIIIGFSIPSVITLSSEGITNYVNHAAKNDYKPVNVWWMNLFSFGDGWHKNHHDKPTIYTTQKKWYEIDVTGIIIKYFLSKKVVTG